MAEDDQRGNGRAEAPVLNAPNKKTGRGRPKASKGKTTNTGGRKRGRKPYPVMTLQDSLRIGQGIAEFGAGHPMKRTTLLEKLKLPAGQTTKDLITASSKYGITTGAHDAEEIGLTLDGAKAVLAQDSTERFQARLKLGILDIEPFQKLYEKFKGGKMPAVEVMRDELTEIDDGDRAPCVDIFVQNAKFLGILETREGAEFIATLEEAGKKPFLVAGAPTGATAIAAAGANQPVVGEDFDTVCFFIAPIGEESSEPRKHSDAILSSYVERSLASVEPKLRVVRADKITQPGMITKQVVEYLLKSRLVVADLSYHNPNVFYELAVRHATGKPVVHLKRATDSMPFDNKDYRTIDIKFEDKFDILSEIETVRSTISQFARQAIATPDSSDNPLLIHFPEHRFSKVTKAVT
jgi:hypothetical protein